jgi:hypothetical protein
MKSSFALLSRAIVAFAILSVFNPSNATMIDFETVPGETPADQLAITTQFVASTGVAFSLSDGDTPFLEQTGGADAGNGFENDQLGGMPDVEVPANAGELGNFYLRIGTTDLSSAPVPELIIDFANPAITASGQIWDIDGNNDGTEQWELTALDANDVVLQTILSPLGMTTGPASRDGKPWNWAFNLSSADIDEIRIEFVGSKAINIGLAFDNFAFTVVPVPAAAWLFGSALGVLAWRRRRVG